MSAGICTFVSILHEIWKQKVGKKLAYKRLASPSFYCAITWQYLAFSSLNKPQVIIFPFKVKFTEDERYNFKWLIIHAITTNE